MKFTEARLEQAIIGLLGKECYPHVLDEAISRGPGEFRFADASISIKETV